MRSFRWLLLVAIALIAAGVFQVYRVQRMAGNAAQRPLPAPLPLNNAAAADNWEYAGPGFDVRAKHMSTSADSKTSQLEDIELHIYQKNGKFYDRVRSPHAEFSNESNRLFAPKDTEITLDVPIKGEPTHPLTVIRTSAVSYNSQTGEAVTDQHVAFDFENGTGTAEGASYNPQTHEIHLLRHVDLTLKSADPKGRAMRVEAGDLVYSETASTVRLGPWSRLTRGETVLNAAASVVNLKERKLDSIDAPSAHGIDHEEGRNLEYSADMVKAQYNDHGQMENLDATGNAKLTAREKGSETVMTGNRLTMLFTDATGESVLSTAQARGAATLESKPVPEASGLTDDTKILKSDSVDVFMRPDGRNLDHVATLAPGTLEFLPNQNARSRRLVKADRMLVRYGANNVIQSYHADAASTETHPSQAEVASKKKNATEIAYTSSRTMDAAFDGKGQVTEIHQNGDFRYKAGVRTAQADTAMLDNKTEMMDLDTRARVADDLGSTAAQHIRIDQNTGDFDARGSVATTRLPDQKPPDQKKDGNADQPGGMLDPGEPMQGKADHVTSASHGAVIHYIDNAVVWQGASRISADKIDIDRGQKMLTATGKVVSQLQDASPTSDPKNGLPPVTLVRSQKMVYTDSNRLAVYTGGAALTHANLNVKCATLQAFLNDGKPVNGVAPSSRVDHAVADGKVEIVQMTAARQRIGTGEHGDYVTSEGKVTLTGGNPKLRDSLKGDSTGDTLTYFTDNDRLLINGAPKNQVEGHILRNKS